MPELIPSFSSGVCACVLVLIFFILYPRDNGWQPRKTHNTTRFFLQKCKGLVLDEVCAPRRLNRDIPPKIPVSYEGEEMAHNRLILELVGSTNILVVLLYGDVDYRLPVFNLALSPMFHFICT